MKAHQTVSIIGVCLLTALVLVACGGGSSSSSSSSTSSGSESESESGSGTGAGAKSDDEVTIGFAQRTTDAPYYVAMQKEAEKLSEEKGFKLDFQSGAGDPIKQIDSVQTMVSEGVDALIVNAVSAETEKTQMTAVAGEVPLLFIDTPIPDVGFTTVQSDNVKIGEGSGELMAERFKTGQKIKLAILNGGPTDVEVGPARREGFLKGLENGGVEYEIEAEATANYTQDEAVPATEDILTAHPDVEAIFAYNDAMGLGAVSVLEKSGNSKVLISSVDGQKEALQKIKEGGCSGQYVSTGLNSPELAAKESVQIALEVATGEKSEEEFPGHKYTKAVGIGCKNVAQYYDPNSTF